MKTGADVVAAARAMLDTPWVHQGRLPGQALDCAGLVICVGRALGLMAEDFDVNGYGRFPDGSLLQVCDQHLLRIAAPEPGAVIVVATQVEAQHLGFIAPYRHGGWAIIHATNSGARPRVVETRLLVGGGMRPMGWYRMPGVAAPWGS